MSTQDPDSNEARLARHRALHNIGLPPHPEVIANRVRAGSEAAPWVIDAIQRIEQQRNMAIGHLHALLNTQRTATQSWEAERAAREWLESIGSEPG